MQAARCSKLALHVLSCLEGTAAVTSSAGNCSLETEDFLGGGGGGGAGKWQTDLLGRVVLLLPVTVSSGAQAAPYEGITFPEGCTREWLGSEGSTK